MSIPLQIGVILFCMLAAGFFAGIETGLISINRLRLRHMVRHHVPRSAIVQRFLQQPDYLLGTTLVGTNLAQVTASVLAVDLGARLFGAAGPGEATAVMAIAVLIFCEYLPKAWFQSSPTLRVLPLAGVLKWSAVVLRPASWAFSTILRLVPAGKRTGPSAQASVSRDELLHLAREGAQTGVLSKAEHRMMRGVFELRGKTCGDIMVPRDRMVYVCQDTPTEELLRLARSTDVNRFPVFDVQQGTFVGIVHIFDVLADANPGVKVVKDYMRPVQLVSSAMAADHVLPRMRVTRQPMVLVTDERYEVIGLVTLSDVLVEVVGEF